MLITDKFVYIHMPKTSGTFVTSVLQRLHNQNKHNSIFHRWHLNNFVKKFSIALPTKYGLILDIEPKHGTCHDIPLEYKNKLILSTIRSPYDWYVSQYEFGWWTKTFEYHPEPYPTPVGSAIETVIPLFQKQHPNFPEISFEEFIDLCCLAAYTFNEKYGTNFGLYSHNFIQFYCQDISRTLSYLASLPNASYIKFSEFEKELFDNIHFLKTHTVNQDLYQFLESAGYKKKDLEFLPFYKKIFPMGRGRRDDQNWEKYYSPNLREFICQLDSLMFQLFPEFEV